MPDWVEHAVWWHVYPLGFVGAEPPDGTDRTLDALTAWLDYAVALGVSGLALGPIFASTSHGYDTLDHFTVDARLGGDEAFSHLAEQCRARGLRILLDGVFNHVGASHPAVAQHPDWFVPAGSGLHTFEGHPGLVTLNHASPQVADLVESVMTHWLDRGADGWRLDAAYAVPTAFWADVLPRVRAGHPDAWFVGEVIHGDYAAIVRDSTMDSVTQYELWKAIWSSINDANLFELAHAVGRHVDVLDTAVPLTFVGNHDVTRIASRIRDPRHLAHTVVLLCTLPGVPSVYYGDEQGFVGVKEDRAGGDDAVRQSLPDEPGQLADFGAPVYRLHQQLIGFRRRHPWLYRARVESVELANTFYAYACRHDDAEIVVALNLSDVEQSVDVALAEVMTDAGARIDAGRLVVPPHAWAVAF